MTRKVEIERKFLLLKKPTSERLEVHKIRQGYIARENGNTVRIRQQDARYILSIKTARIQGGRNELEYDVPKADGEILFASLQHKPIIKTREIFKIDDRIWEVDIFDGANKGLIIAEIELNSMNEKILLPDWVGPEVTELSKFYNANIAYRPFEQWNITYDELVKRLG
jgi:adenylate cyclase